MQDILDYLHHIDPVLAGALGFLCGTLLGHRLALGMERRREFNEIAAPIREKLIAALGNPLYDASISAVQLDQLRFKMWWLHHRLLVRRAGQWRATYYEERYTDGEFGYRLRDAPLVRRRVQGILALLRPR